MASWSFKNKADVDGAMKWINKGRELIKLQESPYWTQEFDELESNYFQ